MAENKCYFQSWGHMKLALKSKTEEQGAEKKIKMDYDENGEGKRKIFFYHVSWGSNYLLLNKNEIL